MPYNTSLKITISRYFTPSGRSIQSVAYTHNAQNATINREEIANRVFKTRNGRSVNEGRGIEPDIEMLSPTPTLMEVALFQQGSIFDFATQYESANSEFSFEKLPDDIYLTFMGFLETSGFDLKLESEQLLDQLEANLDGIQTAGPHIDALRGSVKEEKQQNFDDNEDMIREILYLELISRYQGQTARTKASFNFDPQLEKALELLSESSRIDLILDGNN